MLFTLHSLALLAAGCNSLPGLCAAAVRCTALPRQSPAAYHHKAHSAEQRRSMLPCCFQVMQRKVVWVPCRAAV